MESTQTTEKNRVIGVVTDYDGFLGVLKMRRRELGLSHLATDDLAGLQTGYTGKLECGAKGVGLKSMGGLLGALGLELEIVLAGSKHRSLSEKSKLSFDSLKKLQKNMQAKGGRARARNLSSDERRAIARKAARAKWRNWRLIKAEQEAKAKRKKEIGNLS